MISMNMHAMSLKSFWEASWYDDDDSSLERCVFLANVDTEIMTDTTVIPTEAAVFCCQLLISP
jgi:hypothetical protein